MGGTALTYLCLALSIVGAEASSQPETEKIQPPALVSTLDLIAPEAVLSEPVSFNLVLSIDEQGQVSEVQTVDLLAAEFEWLLLRLLALEFDPARRGGKPISVKVPLTVEAELPLAKKVITRWRVFEEGTSQPVSGVAIQILAGGEPVARSFSDERGFAELALGIFDGLEVVAEAEGYLTLISAFQASPDATLEFEILLMPQSAFGGYRQVVRGKRERTGSRLVLTQKEMTHVAGSLNDPFRTIQTLPGVSSISSYFPLPVVRGTGPNHSSVWIDGFLAPMVFHFLAGPSVIYPELLKDLAYESGDAGIEYGGQIGGVIAARTGFDLSGNADIIEANLNLAQAGLLGRTQTEDDTWIGSGRVGYPGYLLRLGGADLDLTYWDYHGQWSKTQKTQKQRVALYGAGDAFRTPTSVVPLRLQFHRLLYQYQAQGLSVGTMTEVSMTTLPDQPEELTTTALGLNIGYGFSLLRNLRAHVGIQSKVSYDDVDVNQEVVDALIDDFNEQGESNLSEEEPSDLPEEDFLKDAEAWRGTHAAHLAFELEVPSIGLILVPGLRYDFIHQRDNTLDAWTARLRLRQRILKTQDESLYLKASTGLFSQPPRVPLIIPGLDFGLLNLGMQRSWQSSVGLNLERGDWTYSVTGFFSKMSNLSLDWGMLDESGEVPVAVEGQAYGLEVLVRRARARGVFGWLAYTWSRSKRDWGTGWRWFTLDREHVGNLVLGFELERGWGISGRVLYQSGVPQSPEFYGLAQTPRGASFLRFDLRFDRRVIYPTWALEFYVDIGNALVQPESFGPEDEDAAGYVLPMMGVRARF